MMSTTLQGFDKSPDGTAFSSKGPANARALVLIHGFGLSRHIWAPFVEELGKDHHVITYDLYGHGDSEALPGEASLSLFAEQLRTLMDHCGIEKADIIGFSIGGMINRRFAMDYPERCRSLTILNSPHDRGVEGQKRVEDRARKVQEGGKMATLPSALERWFTPQFREENPDVMDLISIWRENTDDVSYAGTAWVLAHGVRELISPSPALQIPSLVITCENDSGSTPQMTRHIAEEIDEAETRIIPELQHLGLMESPQLFIGPIQSFLERT
jgi:pimeloyl-ACP methyl ester carboxylesterase